jgi:hypothetical protein
MTVTVRGCYDFLRSNRKRRNSETLVDPQDRVVHLETEDDTTALIKIRQSAWADRLVEDKAPELVMKLSSEEIPDLVAFLVAEGIRLLSLRPVNRLEEYFLSLTHA